MKIRTKLQALVIVPVAISFAALVFLSLLTARLDAVNRKSESALTIMSMVSDLILLAHEQEVNAGARARFQWTAQYDAMGGYLKNVRPLFDADIDKELMNAIINNHDDAGKHFATLREFDANNASLKPGSMTGMARTNIGNNIILQLQEIPPDAQKIYAMQQENKSRLEKFKNGVILVLFLLIILVMPPVLVIIIKRITLPIDNLHAGMQIIATGNLRHRVRVDSTDEVGVLSQGLNEMAVRIQEITVSRDDLMKEIAIREQAQETLRRREADLNEAQHLAHIGSWDWDAMNDKIWWSDEYYRVFGFDPSKPTPNYEEHRKAYTPESAERLDVAVKRAMEIGESYEVDMELAHPTPDTQWIVARGAAKRDENGKIWGLRGTAQNITERKRAEQAIIKTKEELEQRVGERTQNLGKMSSELQENQMALMNIVEDLNEKNIELEQANVRLMDLDRLKSMFIASMSHELRTPLNSIIGFSSIMLNEWTGPLTAEQKENLSAVLRSGKHLLSLINDVIDVSKIEAGKIETTFEDFDVYDLVMEAVETFRKDIDKKGLALNVRTIRRIMHTDRRRLLQCLLNLLSNAVKYTQHGAIDVRVELSPNGSMILMAVDDTGCGVREQDLDKLFQPFVRLHGPMDSIVPGTGLGLYLTNKLAREILRGDILVSSTYGTGSRFTLRVPMAG